MSQDVKSGKILSPSTPWTERGVPGIQVPDEQTSLKATFTEPTIECPECHALVTRTAMSFNAYVCPQCDEHLRMKARDRLNWFFDQVQTELGQEFKAKDPLKFVDSKPYPARMSEAQTKTGETEALVVMQGLLKVFLWLPVPLNLTSWVVQWVRLLVTVLCKRLKKPLRTNNL